MRRTPRAILTTLLLAATLAPAAGADVNRIVLRVNDRIATLYDYERLKQERIASIQRQPMSEERRQELLARVGEATMRDLYDETLVLSRADQLDVAPSEQAVRAAVENSKQSMGIESDEQFQAALARSGMTAEDLRDQMRKNLMLQEVISREVASQIDLQEEDLRRYYQSHLEQFELPVRLKLREIVVLEGDAASPQAVAELAATLREEIVSDTLTDERLSSWRESGATTGWIDLGWVEKEDLDAELAEVALGLAEGAVSDPVAGRGGLHVLQAVERKEAGVQPFKDVEERIRAIEGNRLYQEELASYSKKLATSSYIVLDPPPEAAGFRGFVDDEGPGDALEDVFTELSGGLPPPAEPDSTEPDG